MQASDAAAHASESAAITRASQVAQVPSDDKSVSSIAATIKSDMAT
jgi:hypothetical protein